jgi:hypothetical protein
VCYSVKAYAVCYSRASLHGTLGCQCSLLGHTWVVAITRRVHQPPHLTAEGAGWLVLCCAVWYGVGVARVHVLYAHKSPLAALNAASGTQHPARLQAWGSDVEVLSQHGGSQPRACSLALGVHVCHCGAYTTERQLCCAAGSP